MGATLLNEVENSRFEDVPGLLERKFSDSVLARGVGHHVDISAIFAGLKNMGATIGSYLPDEKRPECAESGSWSNWLIDSVKSHKERVAYYVNTMICRIEEMFPNLRRDKPRVFDARIISFSSAGAASSSSPFKLDMVLLDRNDAKQQVISGYQIRNAWELKILKDTDASKPGPRKKVFQRLLQSAYRIFTSQSNRRFVCGMTMVNDDAKFYIFDRSGVISSESFNIDMEPEKFLRAVRGFFLTDDTDLGLDPSIVYEGGKRFMTVAGIKYEIQREIYVESCVRGRGTVCFLAVHDNKEYVIKDSWIDDSGSCRVSEYDMLTRLKEVDGVPTMIAQECVKIRGTKDTTATDRDFLHDQQLLKDVSTVLENKWTKANEKTKTREHRRAVIEPFGKRLENFSCLYELVLAIKTIFQTIKRLTNEGVLHQDISLGNIILAKDKNGGPFRKAFLIDFDQAIDMTEQMLEHAKGKRTGTLPFMAIELLRSYKDGKPMFPHAYYHDLESVFYVLCWLCTVLEGPYNKERESDKFDFEMSEVTRWAGLDVPNASLEHIWPMKLGVMGNKPYFEELILNKIAPYFADLKQCLSSIRDVLFPNGETNPEKIEKAMKAVENEMKKAPEDQDECFIDMMKGNIPLSRRKPDDIFADLDRILDDTLINLRKKGKDQPEVPPPRMNRAPNACFDEPLQNAASRIKSHNAGDGAPLKEREKEKPTETEAKAAGAKGELEGKVIDSGTGDDLGKKAALGKGVKNGSAGSGDKMLEFKHGEEVKIASQNGKYGNTQHP
ncbi:hypothetical protein DFH11DRAFT_1548392 [Phellopilus nigrolimitatus]|nr:hypothetical protein DFH11DRAFT_1548392 [Phellopilus nigrolimitatus]